MARAKLTSKGQITIPKEVRTRLGLRSGDELEFVEEPDGYKLRKRLATSPFARWRGHLKHLAGRTTDELMEEMRGE